MTPPSSFSKLHKVSKKKFRCWWCENQFWEKKRLKVTFWKMLQFGETRNSCVQTVRPATNRGSCYVSQKWALTWNKLAMLWPQLSRRILQNFADRSMLTGGPFQIHISLQVERRQPFILAWKFDKLIDDESAENWSFLIRIFLVCQQTDYLKEHAQEFQQMALFAHFFFCYFLHNLSLRQDRVLRIEQSNHHHQEPLTNAAQLLMHTGLICFNFV